MKRALVFVLAVVVLWAWQIPGTMAQDAPPDSQEVLELSAMDISLWPEYDRPEMLVIYRGALGADSLLPAQVEIRIPSGVGQPSAVAYVSDDGGQFNQQYSTRDEGDWLVVAFELSTRRFQVEYYAPLSLDGSTRTYEFDYAADYGVDALSLDVQEPPTAQAFTLEPAADSVVDQANGLTYHLTQVPLAEQGEERSWKVSYQKADDSLIQEPAAPQVPAAPNEGSNQTVLLFLVAFVALFAVGAGAYWLGTRTQPPPLEGNKRSKRRGSGRGPELPREVTSSYYCYQCGSALRPDSEFCHICGAEVRES